MHHGWGNTGLNLRSEINHNLNGGRLESWARFVAYNSHILPVWLIPTERSLIHLSDSNKSSSRAEELHILNQFMAEDSLHSFETCAWKSKEYEVWSTGKRLILSLPRVSGGEINGSPGQLISACGDNRSVCLETWSTVERERESTRSISQFCASLRDKWSVTRGDVQKPCVTCSLHRCFQCRIRCVTWWTK